MNGLLQFEMVRISRLYCTTVQAGECKVSILFAHIVIKVGIKLAWNFFIIFPLDAVCKVNIKIGRCSERHFQFMIDGKVSVIVEIH